MRNRSRLAAVALIVALSATIASFEASTAGAPEIDYGAGSFARIPESWLEAEESEEPNHSHTHQSSDSKCSFTTHADRPHKSSGVNQVSAHGSWRIVRDTNCPSHADVEVKLQGLYCIYGWFDICWWLTLDTQEKRILPGGGRGKRTTARYRCDTNELTGYRNVVDVDLVGVSDDNDKARRRGNVACRPR